MYDKGIILEIKDKYCLAMTEQGAVIRIQKKQGMSVGGHIYILPEDLYRAGEPAGAGEPSGAERPSVAEKPSVAENTSVAEKPSVAVPFPADRKMRSFMKAAACIAASFMLVFISLFTGQDEAYAMVSAVGSADVEFELDKKYRIICVKVYGVSREEKQLSGLVGKKLEEAQPLLRSMAGPEGIIVGYALKKQGNTQAETALARHLENVFSGEAAVYLKGDAGDVENAKANTVSLGIYMAWKEAEKGNRESIDILEYYQKVRQQNAHDGGPDSDGKKEAGPDSGDAEDKAGPDSDDAKDEDAPDSDDAKDEDSPDSDDAKDEDSPDSDGAEDEDGPEDDDAKDNGNKKPGKNNKDDNKPKADSTQSRPAQSPGDNKEVSAAKPDENKKDDAAAGNSGDKSHCENSGGNDGDDNSKDGKDSKDSKDGKDSNEEDSNEEGSNEEDGGDGSSGSSDDDDSDDDD